MTEFQMKRTHQEKKNGLCINKKRDGWRKIRLRMVDKKGGQKKDQQKPGGNKKQNQKKICFKCPHLPLVLA